jgi:predicted metal-dependent hydrolase
MESASIVVRNLRFQLDDEIPKYWLGGQRATSLLLDHLSVVFPFGESFFMASVRAFEKRITDPKLRADVRAFHAQEALHGREHTRYNERLKTLGYPVDRMDKGARRALWLAKTFLPKRGQLAVTAALEHFTSMLAAVALPDDSFLNDAHPEMAAIWRWHAAEESEHAAVAFDVLRTVGGGYLERTGIMAVVTLFFLFKILQHQIIMMATDGILWNASEWRALGRFLFKDPGFIPRVFKPYLAYYRRDFHPDQLADHALLAGWRLQFAQEERYQRSVRAPKRLELSVAKGAAE